MILSSSKSDFPGPAPKLGNKKSPTFELKIIVSMKVVDFHISASFSTAIDPYLVRG